MSERYLELVRDFRETVLGSPGATDPSVRRAVAARAARHGGSGAGAEVPSDLAAFVDKVARYAFEVTQEDVDALRDAGYSEDAIFEITASAAMGAGVGRLQRGLAALNGEV